MDNVDVGRNAIVPERDRRQERARSRRARVGVDLERDRGRFTVSDAGIVVIGKGQDVEP